MHQNRRFARTEACASVALHAVAHPCRRIQTRRRTATVATLALLALLLGCHSDPHSARGVAEQFVDQHYVRINLAAAKPFCAGLALHKIEEEQRLTEGQAIDESTRLPSVHYRLIDQKADDATASFVFEGTIRVDDAGEFIRKWIVTTRHSDDAWKVSNFEEFD